MRLDIIVHLFQRWFKPILVEKDSYLLELCHYIVLGADKKRDETSSLEWSSYRPQRGVASLPEFLRTDWLLEQFGKNRRVAQRRYREVGRRRLGSSRRQARNR